MNMTAARQSLTPKIWTKRFFTEYVRANPFAQYMGQEASDMIQVREDLTAKPGDRVVFTAAHRLKGAGVQGNQLLEGNEELVDLRAMEIAIVFFRHAISVSDWDEQKSIVDILQAGKDALRTWALEKMKSDIILAMSSVATVNGLPVPYAAATAAQRDAWVANNADRVLFGSAVSNNTGAMATSLANVDNTADKATGALVSLAKRRAKLANPRMRPITVENRGSRTAEEWWVLFLASNAFRDFRNDPAVLDAQKNAMERGKDNPLFTGGDLLWDQTIVREVPELPTIAGAGAGGIRVAAGYLCGAQALGIAWARRSYPIQNVRDYGFVTGAGVAEMRGIDKLRFGTDPAVEGNNPVDQGMLTLFTAAVDDA